MIRHKILSITALSFVLVALFPGKADGQLRFCLHSEPKTFNPLLVDDDASQAVRYLTGGVLVRLNRKTEQLEPELAAKWKVSADGRSIAFTIRDNIRFSDGTPFMLNDVAFTMKQLMDPDLHSPTGDSFRSGPGEVAISMPGKNQIAITFPHPVANLADLFDQVAIMSASSPQKEKAVLGPFQFGEYEPGSFLLLKRNPNYWKIDAAGRRLPYLDWVRLDIQQNRDLEVSRFRRGELDLINAIDSDYFDQLASSAPGSVHDAGPSLDSEELWFNQVPAAPIAPYKREWFKSVVFRRAVSSAINRQDMVRLVFHGHAQPAFGPVSPANQLWFNSQLRPHSFEPKAALNLLASEGFRFADGKLSDKQGHAVEFSIITNAGNKARLRMATMMQQDLLEIGIKVNVVTLDFPALIERISHNFDYDACLLGLVNVEVDPNAQMNVWLSSSENHQWNPSQKTPATKWEEDVDRLMKAQAASLSYKKRKQIFDQVQQLVWDNQPFIYLVHKNALSALSSHLRGIEPVALTPQTYWQADRISLDTPTVAKQ